MCFDTLDHAILLTKLKHYGINGKALQLCAQYVEINGVKSGALPITTGVPQGSILGPLLFIIYINHFSLASQVFTFISYTDDTTLFSTLNNFTNTPNIDPNCLINEELFKINEWLEINKLSLNLLLNLRSPRDYVGSSVRSIVRACGSLLERLMSPSPKSQVMFASAFS